MLTLDAATRAEYDAQSLAADKGQAVVDAIVDPVSVTVYDETDAARASGTMGTPWATVVGDRIVIGEVTSFSVTSGAGGAIPAGWTLRFESGARSCSGSFGHSGTDFTWSLPTFETGQGGYLGTVELVPQGNVPVQADYSPSWSVGAAVTKDVVLGWTVAAAGSSPLSFTPPSSINIVQGGTYDLAQHVTGGVPPYTYDHATFSLPAGTTLNFATGLITSSPTATITSGWSVDFGVSDSALTSITKDVLIGWNIDAAPVTPGILPTFGVTSAVGGTSLPFAFGHAFKQGDVPAGQFVNSDLTDWQAVPTTYWPDGSLRHAIIAGRATCSAAVLKNIALSVSATNRSGTALTEADLAAAMPTVTLVAGGDSFTLNSLIGTAARHRTVCSGPVMSNWLYRRAIAGSAHLVAWFDVRLYKGGAVEIFPWVENGYLTVAAPVNDVRTWALTIGGVQRFSQSIDIKHHTRIPLLSGSTFSYWVGTDPQIVPKHDVAYLRATKMVPNFGWTNPSTTKLNSLQQTYTPNTLAGINVNMGTAGSSAAILNLPHALYATSGDARAFRASIAFGLSGGSWSTHFRAEAASTQGAAGAPNEPMRFADYPSASLQIQDTPTIPAGSGGENGTAVTTHQPSYGYLPWLITGRWWFLEESLFWAGWNYLQSRVNGRRGETSYETAPYLYASGSAGVIDTRNGSYTVRGAAWSLRTLAQSAAIVPNTHSAFASLKAAVEANAAFYQAAYVNGTFASGWVNPLGTMGEYSSMGTSLYGSPGGSSAWWGAGWQHGMVQHVMAWAKDLALPIASAAQSSLSAVVGHALKFAAGLAGDGAAGNWNWRRFTLYSFPLGTDGSGLPPENWYATFGAALAEMESANGLGSLAATPGLTLKEHTSNTDLADGSSSLPWFGMQLASLAAAVDNGVTGASQGWSRVTGASNYASVAANYFNDNPEYGITPRSSIQPQTGLLFPSNGVAGGNIGLDWTGANMVPAHSHTVIWKARYVQQTGYYAVAWHCRADDTFAGGGDYIGSSPYPCDGTVNGNGQALNYGAGFTTHFHELVPAGGSDFIASPGGSALAVTKGVWYSQARTVEVINGGAQVRFRFWPDIENNPAFVIEQTFNAGDCALSGAALKFRFGASPWTASGSANSETPSGTLRFLLQYGRALSLSEIQTKIARTTDDTTDPDVWYSNLNPTPSDVSDKSGKGHHPAWPAGNANRPTLVTL